MRTTSVFCAECICGFYFETQAREFICPKCNRLIVFEWGVADDDAQPETAGEKARSEAAA